MLFYQAYCWVEFGKALEQQLLQERIDQVEATQPGCRQIRTHCYPPPLGSIELKQGIYDPQQGRQCMADQELGLPQDAWLPSVLELASALG